MRLGYAPARIKTERFGATGVETDVLDGNAIGGLLLEVFGTEMTAAMCVCGGCGAPSSWPGSRLRERARASSSAAATAPM